MEEASRPKIGHHALVRTKGKGKLGALVRQARVALGLSQGEAATRIGISESIFSRIENGERRVGEAVLRRVAEVLGIPIDDLFVAADLLPAEVGRWILRSSHRLRDIRREAEKSARRG